jgi:hypothetical protein
MRGRVLGTWSAVNNSTLPFGILVYGFLMSNAGLDWTLTVFVAINVIAAACIPFIGPLRDLTFRDQPGMRKDSPLGTERETISASSE